MYGPTFAVSGFPEGPTVRIQNHLPPGASRRKELEVHIRTACEQVPGASDWAITIRLWENDPSFVAVKILEPGRTAHTWFPLEATYEQIASQIGLLAFKPLLDATS